MIVKIISRLLSGVATVSVSFVLVAESRSQDRPMPPAEREALAARGSILTTQDPLAAALQDLLTEATARNGFNIGMGVAEGHTAPGPGKDRICNALLRREPEGCNIAVLFSVERNKHLAMAARGAVMTAADPAFAHTRDSAASSRRFRQPSDRVFFLLGFNIGLGAAEGQTLPGPGKDRIRDSLLHPSEQQGFNHAVSFSLDYNRRVAGESTTGTTDGPGTVVASREIRCRGYSRTGGMEYVFFTINSRPSPTGETLVTYEIAFSPDTRPAGTRGENLRPGFCAFVDRPIAASGPYRIRFETVANAQLKQVLHGSGIDRSTTAAESYPDVNTIPIYLKGENHYWSFGGITDSGRGYFVATSNGYWKPSVVIDNVPGGSPTAPARRHRFPTKP